MKNGVVYIAFKKHNLADHIKECIHSTQTLKNMYPDLHTTIITNKEIKNKCFDNIIVIPIKKFRVKQDILYDHSPYENTLFLDSDTEIVGPIIELFDLMGRFDIAATHDMMRKHEKKSLVYPDYAAIPDGFPEFASGVVMFRKSSTVKKFFRVWQKNYAEWYRLTNEERDQPSFRVSLWQCEDLHIHTLPSEFNIRTKKYDNIVPRINHWHDMWRK